MSVISFGPNQQLSPQQRAAYQTSQKVKQAVWDTSHRLAGLNNVPGVDDPTNGDNVDISSPAPLPPAAEGSLAKFEAQSTGKFHRNEAGQLEEAEVRSQLPDGRQWDVSYRHKGDMLSYSAPSPSGKGQVHVMENLSNGTIAMFESTEAVSDFAAQLEPYMNPAPAPAAAPTPPPSAPGWGAPEQKTEPGMMDKAGGFFKKFMGFGGTNQAQQSAPQPQAAEAEKTSSGPSLSEMAQKGKARATDAVKSESGRKWGKMLIGDLGMSWLDKAMEEKPAEPKPAEPKQ